MSSNVRYIAPEDLFKKSWFFRADLVVEEIATSKRFAVFNAHLNNKSEQARIEGIKIVTSKI